MLNVLLVLRDAGYVSLQVTGAGDEGLAEAQREVARLSKDGFHTQHGRNPVVRVFVESPGAEPLEFSAADVAQWARQ